jgi:hypothetical protein
VTAEGLIAMASDRGTHTHSMGLSYTCTGETSARNLA